MRYLLVLALLLALAVAVVAAAMVVFSAVLSKGLFGFLRIIL